MILLLQFGWWGVCLQIWDYDHTRDSLVLFKAMVQGSNGRRWGFCSEWANGLIWTLSRGNKWRTYRLAGPIQRIS